MLRNPRSQGFFLTIARPAFVLKRDVRRVEELNWLTSNILSAMERAEYSARDRFAVRLALEEALVNGLRHGNLLNPRKQVEVRCRVDGGRVVVSVEDEGEGFKPEQTPDPLSAENLESPSGRGLLLMRHYMSSVRYNARGNRVTLCRRRETV